MSSDQSRRRFVQRRRSASPASSFEGKEEEGGGGEEHQRKVLGGNRSKFIGDGVLKSHQSKELGVNSRHDISRFSPSSVPLLSKGNGVDEVRRGGYDVCGGATEDEGALKLAAKTGPQISLTSQKKELLSSGSRGKSDMLVSTAGKPIWSVTELPLLSPELMLKTSPGVAAAPPINEVTFSEGSVALTPVSQKMTKAHKGRANEPNASFATATTVSRSSLPPSPITPLVKVSSMPSPATTTTPHSSTLCSPNSSSDHQHLHHRHRHHHREEAEHTEKRIAGGFVGYESAGSIGDYLIQEVAEAVAARDSSLTPNKKRRRKRRRRHQNRKTRSEKVMSALAMAPQPDDRDIPRRRSSNGSHHRQAYAQTYEYSLVTSKTSLVPSQATLSTPSTPTMSPHSGVVDTVGSSSGHALSDSISNHTSGLDEVQSAASTRSRKSQQSANSRKSSISIKSLRAIAAKAKFRSTSAASLPTSETSSPRPASFHQKNHNVSHGSHSAIGVKVGMPKRRRGSHSDCDGRSGSDQHGARRRRTFAGTALRQDFLMLDSQDSDDLAVSPSENLLMQYLIDSGKNTREAAFITAKFSVESKNMRRSSSLLSLSHHLDDTKSSSKSGSTLVDDISIKSWGRNGRLMGSATEHTGSPLRAAYQPDNNDMDAMRSPPWAATDESVEMDAGNNNSGVRPRGIKQDEWITKEKLTAMTSSNGSFGTRAVSVADTHQPDRNGASEASAENAMLNATLSDTGVPPTQAAAIDNNATTTDWKSAYRIQFEAERAANANSVALSSSSSQVRPNMEDYNVPTTVENDAGFSEQTRQCVEANQSPVLVRASRPGAEQMRVRAYGQRPSWARRSSEPLHTDHPSYLPNGLNDSNGTATSSFSASVVPSLDVEEGRQFRPSSSALANAQVEPVTNTILEAHAVDANGFVLESDIPVVEADVMPPVIMLVFKSWRSRSCCALIILIVVVVSLFVALVNVGGSSVDGLDENSEGNQKRGYAVETFLPTSPPTSAPTRDSSEILSALEQFSSIDDLTRPGTPQHSAMQWLLNVDGIGLQLDDRMYVQRYAIVVLVFATCTEDKNREAKSFAEVLNPTLHECDWGYGVSCSQYTGNQYVSSLELSKNSLDGTLPTEIGLFERLEFLDMHENKLRGSIPESIGNLFMLDYIDLSNNGLTGSVPWTIKDNIDLTTLSLGHNELSGSIPNGLWNLEKIRTIDLRYNFITGHLSSALSNLNVLTHLDLTMNLISESVPKELTTLPDLAFLFLGDNLLSGPLPVNPKHASRKVDVVLRNNLFAGNIPINRDKGNAPIDFSVTEKFRLQKLDVSGNMLNGTVPSLIGFIGSIKHLDFSRNELSGSIPHTYGRLGLLEQLEHISFSENKLSGTLPDVGNSLRTRFLDVHGNNLRGALPSSFGSYESLEYLDVSENKKIEGGIPLEYGEMVSVRKLLMRGCDLSGKIPTQLGKLSFIEFLDLGENSFSRTVPIEIGTMKSLRELYLDSNRLIGKIPKSVGTLDKLQILKLNNNKLQGPIPRELSNLMDLEEVHLEDNRLSGIIPEKMCKLHDHKLTFIKVDCEIECGCCQVNQCP